MTAKQELEQTLNKFLDELGAIAERHASCLGGDGDHSVSQSTKLAVIGLIDVIQMVLNINNQSDIDIFKRAFNINLPEGSLGAKNSESSGT